MSCDSDDLIIYITTGNQTQCTVFVDKPCQTVVENAESKAIQVHAFNVHDSQMQTISVVTKDIQVQSDLKLKTFDECSSQTSNSNYVADSAVSNIHRESFNYENTLEKKIGMHI